MTVSAYDTISFQSHPTPERHPQRIAAIATIFGLSPRGLSGARILEIGCGSGLHLLAQAHDLPDAEFFGIDLSKEHIVKAKEIVLQTGTGNVKFFHGDITHTREVRGTYDFVICHGVYSWVREEIRESILEFLKIHLSKNGLCLLSYNALPGWSTRSDLIALIREFDDEKLSISKRLENTKALLEAQYESLADASELHEIRLKKEIEACLKRSDGFFVHELLNEESVGYYLSDVVAKASEHDLQYVGDAQPYRMHRPSLRADLPTVPAKYSRLFETAVQYELFFDTHYPQAIRSSIFCRSDVQPSLTPIRDTIFQFFLASPLVPLEEPVELQGDKAVEFGTPHKDTVEVSAPIVKAALVLLHRQWPRTMQADELFDLAWGLIGEGIPFQGIRDEYSTGLLRLFALNLVECYTHPLLASDGKESKPETSALAKYQVEHEQTVTTLRHEVFLPNELQKRLILLCDGGKTKDQIALVLIDEYRQGKLSIREEGQELANKEEGETLLVEGIKNGFEELAEAALLSE